MINSTFAFLTLYHVRLTEILTKIREMNHDNLKFAQHDLMSMLVSQLVIKAVSRALIGGGGTYSYIRVLIIISFESNLCSLKSTNFERK